MRGIVHIQLLGRNGNYVAVFGAVQIRGDLDDTFKKIQSGILKTGQDHGQLPKELILQGGGSIPLPGWFRDWCQDNGIRIRLLDAEAVLAGRVDVDGLYFERVS